MTSSHKAGFMTGIVLVILLLDPGDSNFGCVKIHEL